MKTLRICLWFFSPAELLMLVLLTPFVLAVDACANSPLSNAPAPGEPCGRVEYPCGDGSCCPNDSACGGTPFSGCAADSCCFEGGGGYGSRPAVPKRWLVHKVCKPCPARMPADWDGQCCTMPASDLVVSTRRPTDSGADSVKQPAEAGQERRP